ncbi:MAG: anti-sigma factor antagonist [Acidobacteriota bacterium]
MSAARIAAIVPTYEERSSLPRLVEDLRREGIDEVIVADGDSPDGTASVARSLGAKVVVTTRCRGVQLNAGAAEAGAPLLLFLHADSRLPAGASDAIAAALARERVVLGAFALAIDATHAPWWTRLSLGLVGGGATLRARLLSLPYGDQGLFMTRAAFDRLGGFPPIARCEDLDLVLARAAPGRSRSCRFRRRRGAGTATGPGVRAPATSGTRPDSCQTPRDGKGRNRGHPGPRERRETRTIMKISARSHDSVVILDLEGKITMGLGDRELRQSIDKLIVEGRHDVLLNFSGVTYIDSSGVSELVQSFKALRNLGGHLKIENLSNKVYSTLQIAKLLPIFEIFDNEGAALGSFKGHAVR